mmetsp:Transcript_6184/g.13461  ORF Transcript_6184/g.13461 Transcript_6184/m.13461 type:complete len:211 (+) Transcript_6184:693-1325(+)
MGRTTLTPVHSMGTRIMDCCLCAAAVGSVLPMKIAILQRGSHAPLVHHLMPFSTYWLPDNLMEACMLVASDDATSFSVMAKQLLICPLSRGSSQACCCSLLPYLARISMLPVSGAEQLKHSGAHADLPMISQRCAYSRFDSPAPSSTSLSAASSQRGSRWCSWEARLAGSHRFHRPSAFALALSCSCRGCMLQRCSPAACVSSTSSAGYT